ncbi:hypothetical protein [Cohnella yongneupensis]|uniref:Prolow-density lipoprotein receptor-related protein 1-like beta-propeller domain-containing protein n=1 Tax=Cohnella yongneupensis TaxID=425006 RepID=A0ABW0QTQ5_9BACL
MKKIGLISALIVFATCLWSPTKERVTAAAVSWQTVQVASFYDNKIVTTPDGMAWTIGVMECNDGYNPDKSYTNIRGVRHVQSTAIGEQHALMLNDVGEVYAIGCNKVGQMGMGHIPSYTWHWNAVRIPGMPAVRQIAAEAYMSYALDQMGMIWYWGNDIQYVPKAVEGYTATSISANGNSGFVASMSDGTVWQGSFEDDHSLSMMQLTEYAGISSISSRDGHVLALGRDGTVWEQSYGEDGRQVPGLPTIKAISAGDTFALALDEKDTLWSWRYGEEERPSQVPGLANVVSFFANYGQANAATASGKLYEWHYDDTSKLTPTIVTLPPYEVKFNSLEEFFLKYNVDYTHMEGDTLYFSHLMNQYEIKKGSLTARISNHYDTNVEIYDRDSPIAKYVISRGYFMDRIAGDWIYYLDRVDINKPLEYKRIKKDGTGESLILRGDDKDDYIWLDHIEGDWFYYNHDIDGGQAKLLRKNMQTGKTEVVLSNFDFFPVGPEINFNYATRNSWNMRFQTETTGISSPYFENNKIYYTVSGVLYSSNLDGTGKKRLMKAGQVSFYEKIIFAKDWIYYYTYPGSVYKVKKDGSQPTRIIKNVVSDFFMFDGVMDGWLYYTDSDLYKIRLDGTQKTKLFDVENNLNAVIDSIYNDKFRIKVFSMFSGIKGYYLYESKTKTKKFQPTEIQPIPN